MVCPVCRCEYRPGFVRCADCGVDLVDDLGKVRNPEAGTAILCATRDPMQVALIRSLLDAAGIRYGVLGEASPVPETELIIVVPGADLLAARECLLALKDPTEVSPADPPGGSGQELIPET